MQRSVTRKAAILAAAAAAGVVALAANYVVLPTTLPARGEYFLTELAKAQIGPVSVLIALASAFAFGFYLQAQPVLVGLFIVAVFPLISIYESTAYRGSHNLLPFEMAIIATWSMPLVLAAWVGGWMARRTSRRDIWNAT